LRRSGIDPSPGGCPICNFVHFSPRDDERAQFGDDGCRHDRTAEALAEIDEIASVEGVDLLLIGTNVLCSSLGIPGQLQAQDGCALLT
jgi:hypothetical protein